MKYEQSWAAVPVMQRPLLKHPCSQAPPAFRQAAGPLAQPHGGSPSPSSAADRCAGLCRDCAKALCAFMLGVFMLLVSLSPFSDCCSFLNCAWRTEFGKGGAGGHITPVEYQGVKGSVPQLSSLPAEQPWP